ncbi:hypothetical protein [Tuberibacillus sp. Marseille-P3662]|uniref:hypothetical protein n=1 Tax=Tuberibacillus sp. Marseille-P3662 TaxID=1965358 RepID=UPI000A1C904A|nr:hypothetical protein [Tuberibacillus sp. Marseille-P3662]
MKRIIKYILTMTLIFALTGCVDPESNQSQTHKAYQTDINTVEAAVRAFKEAKIGLPIENFNEDTPKYLRYKIDFNRLVPDYLPKPPANAYQKGGYFQYVIVHPEQEPQVKVLDVAIYNQVKRIQKKVDRFRARHGYAPLADMITPGRYKINFEQLGYDSPPKVTSPYSGQPLGFVLNNDSQVFINYLPDIYQTLNNTDKTYKPGEDLRQVLVQNSPYVPVKSLPYTLKNGDIVFLIK